MSNVTIPALPAGSNPNGSEPFETVQGGVSVRLSLDQIFDYITQLPLNNQTGTAYTLALADDLSLVTFNNAGAITLTIPTNATVAYRTGATIAGEQLGVGVVTIAAAGGVTLQSFGAKLKSAGQFATWVLIYRGADIWSLSGNLST